MLQLIRRDVGLKFLGEVVSRAVFLLFFFYVGRKMGSSDFGTLNLALSTTYILGVVFLDPGLNLSTIQLLVAGDENREKVASAIFTSKLLLAIPLLLALWALSYFMGNRLPPYSVLLLAALYALFTAVLEYLSSVTNAYHRMDLEAYLKVFNRLCIVFFCAAALRWGRTVAVLWGMWTATFLTCLLGWILLHRKLVEIRFVWAFDILKRALKAGLPIAGTIIVSTIYLKWDLLVLSYFNMGKQEIGWYAGAFKIMEAFSALPGILGAALFPLMVQLRSDNPGNLDRLLRVVTKAVLLFSIPTAAAISLFSRPLITMVYGPSYAPAAAVLAILIWCIVPIFLYFYLLFVNIAAGHASHNLLAGCLALIAGLVANALLVPRLGYVGAAWSALVANSSFAVLATGKVCVLFRNAGIPRMLLKFVAAGGLMVAAGFAAPSSLGVQFAVELVVFAAVLVGLGALSGEDAALVWRMLQVRIQPQTTSF